MVILRRRFESFLQGNGKMKENSFTDDKNLETAKEYLDKMLAGLDREEKNDLLKMLLELTENM